MKTFLYFPVNNHNIRKLFKAWNGILVRHEKADKDDLPYWYLERTNIGHLALAAYKLNGYSLQEFSMKKGRGQNKSTGRADLYMYFPLSDTQWYDFNIEAKQIWCSLSMKDDQKVIKNALKKAEFDIKKHNDKEFRAKYAMAILFVLPYMKVLDEKRVTKEQLLSKFNRQIKQTVEETGASFAAVHYADIDVSTKLSKKYTKSDWYPGIVVIGKITNTK